MNLSGDALVLSIKPPVSLWFCTLTLWASPASFSFPSLSLWTSPMRLWFCPLRLWTTPRRLWFCSLRLQCLAFIQSIQSLNLSYNAQILHPHHMNLSSKFSLLVLSSSWITVSGGATTIAITVLICSSRWMACSSWSICHILLKHWLYSGQTVGDSCQSSPIFFFDPLPLMQWHHLQPQGWVGNYKWSHCTKDIDD